MAGAAPACSSTDAYVWEGVNLAGAPLRERLGRVQLDGSGPSDGPWAALCPYEPEPPADGRWARLPLEGAAAPTETRDPWACVVRALCGGRGEALVLGDGGRPVPLTLQGGTRRARAGTPSSSSDGDAGEWRPLAVPCEGPATPLAEAVARLALLAAHRASAARPNM